MRHSSSLSIISSILRQTGAILLLSVIIGLCVNQVRSKPLPLLTDWMPQAAITIETVALAALTLNDVRQCFENKTALFVDTRSGNDYRAGHLCGAWNINDENFEEQCRRMRECFSFSHPVIVYGADGSSTSGHRIAEALIASGFQDVSVFVSGWQAWIDAGLPVETGSEPAVFDSVKEKNNKKDDA